MNQVADLVETQKTLVSKCSELETRWSRDASKGRLSEQWEKHLSEYAKGQAVSSILPALQLLHQGFNQTVDEVGARLQAQQHALQALQERCAQLEEIGGQQGAEVRRLADDRTQSQLAAEHQQSLFRRFDALETANTLREQLSDRVEANERRRLEWESQLEKQLTHLADEVRLRDSQQERLEAHQRLSADSERDKHAIEMRSVVRRLDAIEAWKELKVRDAYE